MTIVKVIQKALSRAGVEVRRRPPTDPAAENIKRYLALGRIPWSQGYVDFRDRFIDEVLSTPERMKVFRLGLSLPPGYGQGLDERCVEWPWFFAKANPTANNYLDAGSTLNHSFLIRKPFWQGKRLTILTLAPEPNCYWNLAISYQYADLRDTPFRENLFDEIACLSTLEHVGMDNFFYTQNQVHQQQRTHDFEQALLEMRRTLKREGRLLLTLPFGKYQNWGTFQQFDASLLDHAAQVCGARNREETFYLYTADGWQVAARDDCAGVGFSEYAISQWKRDPAPSPPTADLAAAARAVACCVWQRD